MIPAKCGKPSGLLGVVIALSLAGDGARTHRAAAMPAPPVAVPEPPRPRVFQAPSRPAPAPRDRWSLKVHAENRDDARAVEMARRLTEAKLQPPAWRLDHYKIVGIPDGFKHVGWYGFIAKIEPGEGGAHVTIRVGAKIDHACDSYFCLEKYSVTDRGIRFIGAEAPNRNAVRYFVD